MFFAFVGILPVYNEELDLLIKGIHSLLDQEYTKEMLELHISFDDDIISSLYLGVMKHFNQIERHRRKQDLSISISSTSTLENYKESNNYEQVLLDYIDKKFFGKLI